MKHVIGDMVTWNIQSKARNTKAGFPLDELAQKVGSIPTFSLRITLKVLIFAGFCEGRKEHFKGF